jgi:hypothetical protein
MVDWEMVHMALCQVPWMFQIWACKQVMALAKETIPGNAHSVCSVQVVHKSPRHAHTFFSAAMKVKLMP